MGYTKFQTRVMKVSQSGNLCPSRDYRGDLERVEEVSLKYQC